MRRLHSLLLVALLAPLPAAAQQLVLFEHAGFRGQSRTINGDTPNFRDLGFNDRASSLRVLGGAWEVCEDADFGGRCQVVDGDVPNLADNGWNDRISSARPARRLERREDGDRRDRGDRWGDRGDRRERGDERRGGRRMRSEITVYSAPGFRGESRSFDGFVENLQDARYNDRIASLRIGSGVWEGCEHANFRGRCVIFDGDEWDLSFRELGHRISSLRPIEDEHVDYRDRGSVIILYEHEAFRGESRRLGRDNGDLSALGFENRASSVRVRGGAWELCDAPGFHGHCVVIDDDVQNLRDRGLNDRVSSLRRVDRRRGR
jgi:hypothetical protein